MKINICYFLFIALACSFFVACNDNFNNDSVYLSFKGDAYSLIESDEYIYCVSNETQNGKAKPTYYINSFKKNGIKRFEIEVEYGQIFPLRDGRFFYASDTGSVMSYDKNGKLIHTTEIKLDNQFNSNFFLDSEENLMVNTISSPNTSSEYMTITFDGKKTLSPKYNDLTSSFTSNYPKGGYIVEGFTDDYKWHISRINKDFSSVWTYTAEENNIHIQDISSDGDILFSGYNSDMSQAVLKELDENGKVKNSIDLHSTNITAKYFKENIVAVAEKIKVFDANFELLKVLDEVPYSQIKIFNDSFFVYTRGSYTIGNSVAFDGYCKQYDKDNCQVLNKIFKEKDGFIAVGNNGKLYFKNK